MPEHRKKAYYILFPVLPIKDYKNKTLQDIKPLKTSIHFSYIYKFSSYHKVNIHSLDPKQQSVDAV
jgi:hypothetical protein